MFENDKSIYKYPLHDTIEFRDLREMSERSEREYGDEIAYLIKDPVALREAAPRAVATKDRSNNPKQEYRGVTFKQFHQDRKALGTALHSLGIKPDDKVIILAETRYEWYVSYLATVAGLAIIAPMDKGLSEQELLNLFERSRANTILYSDEVKDKVSAIAPQAEHLKNFISYDLPTAEEEASGVKFFWDLLEEGYAMREGGNTTYDILPINNEELAILLFTSGTTAKSKAVMLSHKNISTDIEDTIQLVSFGRDDTSLSVLPLHHTYEATAGFLLLHAKGAKVAVLDGIRHLTTNLAQSKTTVVIAVPLVLESIYRTVMKRITSDKKTERTFNFGVKLSRFLRAIGIDIRRKIFNTIHEGLGGHIRLFVAGGAAPDPEVLDWFEDVGFLSIQGYGVTESSPIIAANRDHHKKNDAAGLPLRRAEMKIDNPDENGIGEIIARGPYIMLGYYEDEERTREAIDEEGFYHTGDYGYIDDENFIHITGRKANIIVTQNGKNIFPEEIEFVLTQNIPLILETVVFGTRTTSGNQEVSAEVFCDKEYMDKHPQLANLALDSEELRQVVLAEIKEVNKKLQPYQRVKHVTLRDEPFERNTSRKILRQKYNQVN